MNNLEKGIVFISIFSLFLIVIISCEKDDEIFYQSFIEKQWIYEGSLEGIEIYRAGNLADFPPSWYRQIFYFGKNNICEYSILAPDDGQYMAKGKWKYNEISKIIRISNSDV